MPLLPGQHRQRSIFRYGFSVSAPEHSHIPPSLFRQKDASKRHLILLSCNSSQVELSLLDKVDEFICRSRFSKTRSSMRNRYLEMSQVFRSRSKQQTFGQMEKSNVLEDNRHYASLNVERSFLQVLSAISRKSE